MTMNKKLSNILMTLAILFGITLNGCKKEEDSLAVETISAEVMDGIGCHVVGRINNGGESAITEYGFCWSYSAYINDVEVLPEATINGLKKAVGTTNHIGAFEMDTLCLNPNSKLTIRAYAINANNVAYGKSITLTTTVGLPSIDSIPVLEVTTASITVGFSSSFNGGEAPKTMGVCWSTEPNPTIANNKITLNYYYSPASFSFYKLAANTKYYFKTFCTNSAGIVYSAEQSATTNSWASTYPQTVFVEGGTFQMGCTDSQGNCKPEELPVHTVTVNSFNMCKYEITYEQYIAFLNSKGVNADGTLNGKQLIQIHQYSTIGYDGMFYFAGDVETKGIHSPMGEVTYAGAGEYARWLYEQTGQLWRLPTEAEWEYAARGGKNSKDYRYSGSNNIGEVGWISTTPTQHVGLKLPNELGIYDMTGNVSEICKDWYSATYYASSPQDNPQGPLTGETYVCRGGDGRGWKEICTVFYRYSSNFISPSYSEIYDGFRLCRVD